MFNVKKIVSLLCSVALVAATVVVPVISASADPAISFGMRTGNTAPGTSGLGANKKYTTNVVVTLDGMFNSEEDYLLSNGALFEFYVTKGAFSGVNVTSLGENGLIGAVYGRDASFTANISPIDGNNDYDLLSLMFGGADGYTTMTGDAVELKLTYTAKSDFPDVVFIPKADSSYLGLCDDSLTRYATISDNGFVGLDYKYEVAGGSTATNVVNKSAISSEPTDPEPYWVDATVNEFSSEIDNSVAVAARATLSAADAEGDSFDTVTWKVTKDEVVKGRRSALKTTVEGEGTVTVGLAIGGINAANLAVQAALGAWGN